MGGLEAVPEAEGRDERRGDQMWWVEDEEPRSSWEEMPLVSSASEGRRGTAFERRPQEMRRPAAPLTLPARLSEVGEMGEGAPPSEVRRPLADEGVGRPLELRVAPVGGPSLGATRGESSS